jgi:hypothetical protein
MDDAVDKYALHRGSRAKATEAFLAAVYAETGWSHVHPDDLAAIGRVLPLESSSDRMTALAVTAKYLGASDLSESVRTYHRERAGAYERPMRYGEGALRARAAAAEGERVLTADRVPAGRGAAKLTAAERDGLRRETDTYNRTLVHADAETQRVMRRAASRTIDLERAITEGGPGAATMALQLAAMHETMGQPVHVKRALLVAEDIAQKSRDFKTRGTARKGLQRLGRDHQQLAVKSPATFTK